MKHPRPVAVAAWMRKAGPMHDRRAPRGGAGDRILEEAAAEHGDHQRIAETTDSPATVISGHRMHCPGCSRALVDYTTDSGRPGAAVVLWCESEPRSYDCYCDACGWSGIISPDNPLPAAP